MYRRRAEFTSNHSASAMLDRRMASVPVCRVQLVREASRVIPAEINEVQDAAEAIEEHLIGADREHFVILMLDAKNQLLGIHTVSVGTLNATLISPREVFKAAILANAASVIAGHNHPSGDPAPSPEDFVVTDRLRAAGAVLDIELLDHVIVGANSAFTSLRQTGMWGASVASLAGGVKGDAARP